MWRRHVMLYKNKIVYIKDNLNIYAPVILVFFCIGILSLSFRQKDSVPKEGWNEQRIGDYTENIYSQLEQLNPEFAGLKGLYCTSQDIALDIAGSYPKSVCDTIRNGMLIKIASSHNVIGLGQNGDDAIIEEIDVWNLQLNTSSIK